MISTLGKIFTDLFIRYMPSAYVFALLLTLFTGFMALIWTDASLMNVLSGWYDGFWSLLAFGMQIILVIVTAYSIAQSDPIAKGINWIARFINTPGQVYLFVLISSALFSLISFGMIVIVAILARELAVRVKGLNYPFLIACVYFGMGSWVAGASSSIALLLNTEDNFLIEAGILSELIPTAYTLGSSLNLVMILLFVVVSPLLFFTLIPKNSKQKELSDLLILDNPQKESSVKAEADSYKLPFKAVSDILNNSAFLQVTISIFGFIYIGHYFYQNGFDLNFNIIIFMFLILGLFLHKTPLRYSISMKRASSNISGILFQYPFYAGIMGIMFSTGLGDKIGEIQASFATMTNYPFLAYVSGGLVNFAIPSAGGEFAVIGPSIINVVKDLGAGLGESEVTAMIARASMAIAYGESLSNALQPFYLLIIFPVMAAGTKLQARDIMGFFVIPFILFFIIQSLLLVYMPL
ncbi:TIGR00366 family protein [uncultured Eudoraea sp.]|uniref:short-chain fatty acid transporter n=1 Tax=uncultured Eudoraea sp. TaxID=1035614 RepID=UPI00261E966E|nr:TIGR00366 family protein [uncultured Eudoraea sp.]